MKTKLNWFEIPAENFERAVKFYEHILKTTIDIMEGSGEKMGFIPEEVLGMRGAISKADGFLPCENGVLINFHYDGPINDFLSTIEKAGGKILTQKTKIEDDDHGYFALFSDTEGNRLGVNAKI
jgi:hypothetical protein